MKMNTTRLRQTLKTQAQRFRLYYLAYMDAKRFWRTASFSAFDADYEKVVARIMYNVHAIEKGLARNHDIRHGFGRKALANLNDSLVVFREAGYSESDYAYAQGVSVLRRYVELHERANAAVEFLPEVVDPYFLEPVRDLGVAGTHSVRRADKRTNSTKGFPELARGRSSVREFSGRSISKASVMQALRYAEKTPSVCNRQGWRVYWVEDKALSKQVLTHQRGFGYPLMPEVLLCITVTNSAFVSPVERNESFVDGGLFSMSVLYGLEHEGLAAVPLNAMMYRKDQLAVRRLLSIAESEMIIMFIAIGDFAEESLVPASDRRRADDFVTCRGAQNDTIGTELLGHLKDEPAVLGGRHGATR